MALQGSIVQYYIKEFIKRKYKEILWTLDVGLRETKSVTIFFEKNIHDELWIKRRSIPILLRYWPYGSDYIVSYILGVSK